MYSCIVTSDPLKLGLQGRESSEDEGIYFAYVRLSMKAQMKIINREIKLSLSFILQLTIKLRSSKISVTIPIKDLIIRLSISLVTLCYPAND